MTPEDALDDAIRNLDELKLTVLNLLRKSK